MPGKTTTGSTLNMNAGEDLATFTARGDRFIRVAFLFSSLAGSAATFSFTLTHKTSGGTNIRVYTDSIPKSVAGQTTYGETILDDSPVPGIFMRNGETLTVNCSSSNAADLSVNFTISFIDPKETDTALSTDLCQAGATASTIKLSAADISAYTGARLKGTVVDLIAGTGAGQAAVITGSPTASLHPIAPNWTTTPDATSVYRLRSSASNIIGINGDAASVTAGVVDVNMVQVSGSQVAADNLQAALDGSGTARIEANTTYINGQAVSDPDFVIAATVVTNQDKTGYVLASNGLGAVHIGGGSDPTIVQAIGIMATMVSGLLPATSPGEAGSTGETFTLWGSAAKGQVVVTTPNAAGARTAVVITGTATGNFTY